MENNHWTTGNEGLGEVKMCTMFPNIEFDIWYSDVFASLCFFFKENVSFLKKVFFFSWIEFSVSIELISNFCFVLSQRPQFNNPAVPIVVSKFVLKIKKKTCWTSLKTSHLNFFLPSDLNDQYHNSHFFSKLAFSNKIFHMAKL